MHTAQGVVGFLPKTPPSSENTNIHAEHPRDADVTGWTCLSFYKLLFESSNRLIIKHLNYMCQILWSWLVINSACLRRKNPNDLDQLGASNHGASERS